MVPHRPRGRWGATQSRVDCGWKESAMADRNLRSLIGASHVVRRQFEDGTFKTGRYQADEEGGYRGPMKKASPETLEARARMADWERRSNRCPVCNEAKAKNGSCACD
jgi:hypothetical protein